MKRVVMMTVALALSVMVAGQAMAQPEGRKQRPEGGQMRAAGPMAGAMAALRGLDLSEQQRTDVRAIMASAREELQQLAQKAALTVEQQQKRRESVGEVMAEVRAGSIERGQARAKIEEATASVLTPEQKEATEALQKKVEEVLGSVKKVMTSEQVKAFEEAMAQPQRLGRGDGAGRGPRPEGGERPTRRRPEN